MSNIALPFAFAPSTVAKSSEVNADLNEIATKFNSFAVQTDVAKTITAAHTFSADILFTDNLYDIGKSGATRPRDLFLSRSLTVSGTAQLNGVVGVGTSNDTAAREIIFSNASNNFKLRFTTATGNQRLAFVDGGGVERFAVENGGNVPITGAVGINGKTPVANVAAPAIATDLASVITLANDERTRLINFGIYT